MSVQRSNILKASLRMWDWEWDCNASTSEASCRLYKFCRDSYPTSFVNFKAFFRISLSPLKYLGRTTNYIVFLSLLEAGCQWKIINNVIILINKCGQLTFQGKIRKRAIGGWWLVANWWGGLVIEVPKFSHRAVWLLLSILKCCRCNSFVVTIRNNIKGEVQQ